MMRGLLLLCGLLTGCVLPDYSVTEQPNQTPLEQSREPAGLLKSAPESCNECLKSECTQSRDDCGDNCSELSWPVSPAWKVADEADAFVTCVSEHCSDACEVPWGCVKKYDLAAPPDALEVSMHFTGVINGFPVANVKVNACAVLDPDCTSGGGEQNAVTSDANGRAFITLPKDFFGYFLVDAGDDFYPMTVMLSQPTYRVDNSLEIAVFPRVWIAGLSATIDVPAKKTDGHVIFRAQNCLPLRYLSGDGIAAAADGVGVSYDTTGPDTSRTFYTSYGLMLDPDATASQTVGGGFGGALNVPVGLRSVSGDIDGNEVARTSIRMRAGTVGLVFLVPKTRQ